MAGFRDTLKDAVRQLSFRTSVDSLKQKGVQQVNVLGLDRITTLIEQAVLSGLKSRLFGVEREAVAGATKAEFLRLLRSNADLQRQKSEIERQRERAEEEVDQLRRELAQQQRALQVRLEQDAGRRAARYQGEDAAIAGKVHEVVQALTGAPGLTSADLERHVFELVMDVVARERAATETARRALHDREVDNLQRRINKLSETLATTEQRLQQVTAAPGVDAGISSIYREVQGLPADAAQAGRKRELMAEIFAANLRLQRRAAAGNGPPARASTNANDE